MKAVLMSVRPQHCENICTVIGYDKDGKPIYKKRIEVRKTKPKLEVPFKVYIYCTKPRKWWAYTTHLYTSDEYLWLSNGKVKMCDGFEFWAEGGEYQGLNGKVIGEFICDEIIEIMPDVEIYGIYDISDDDVIKTCLVNGDLWNYGKGKNLYGLHISDLEIYDKPKELSEFYRECETFDCDSNCKYFEREYTPSCDECWCSVDGKIPITRPPQSWCYVEEVRV